MLWFGFSLNELSKFGPVDSMTVTLRMFPIGVVSITRTRKKLGLKLCTDEPFGVAAESPGHMHGNECFPSHSARQAVCGWSDAWSWRWRWRWRLTLILHSCISIMTSQAKADQNLRGSGRRVTRAKKQPAEAVSLTALWCTRNGKKDRKKRKESDDNDNNDNNSAAKKRNQCCHTLFFIFVKIKNKYQVTLQTHTDTKTWQSCTKITSKELNTQRHMCTSAMRHKQTQSEEKINTVVPSLSSASFTLHSLNAETQPALCDITNG